MKYRFLFILVYITFSLVVLNAQNIIYPGDAGVVDITKAPYNADNTGTVDVTATIQQAVDDHTPNGTYIIYFPAGTYLVSDEIRWGDDAWNQGPAFEGQDKENTIIRLTDNNPLYQDPSQSKALIWTGNGSADNFRNEIRNLTINTGSGNPGACGIKFNSNNMGTIKNVDIISGDGSGVIGLDMAYTDMIGPLFINKLYVNGFNIGVKTGGGAVNSMTLEDITIENQRVTGFVNGGQVVSIRNLKSINSVQAVRNNSGDMVLIDSHLEGTGEASSLSAIYNNSRCFLRNIEVTGYGLSFENNAGLRQRLTGEYIAEQVSHKALGLFDNPGLSLDLPVKEIPEVPWEQDMNNWVNVQDFGAVADDGQDDSQAIQQAIDQDKSTVYLPNGKYRLDQMIQVTGNVSRIIGTSAIIEGNGGFELKDGTTPVVIIERLRRSGPTTGFTIKHSSSRTLVISNFSTRVIGNGTGDFFMVDVVGGPHVFNAPGQHIWCRQLDTEQGGAAASGDATNVRNNGSSLWVLGYKTENSNIKVETTSGGSSEILGHFCYALGNPKTTPMYVVDDASLSIAGMRQSYYSSGIPYEEFVSETRDGVTRILKKEDAVHDNAMPLFVGYNKDLFEPEVQYPLNETEGNIAHDSSANAFDAILEGDIAGNWNADSGAYGGAVHLNGTNNYLLLAGKETTGGKREIYHGAFSRQTLSLWFKADNTPANQFLFSRGSNLNGYAVQLNNGQIRAGFAHNGSLDTLTAGSVKAHEWEQITLTFEEGLVRMYLGGNLASEKQLAYDSINADGNTAVAGARVNADPFGTGSDGSAGAFFQGWLDRIMISDSVPGRRVIEKLAFLPRKTIKEIYFSMDRIANDTLFEDTGTGLIAKLHGIRFETEGVKGTGLNFNGLTNWVELQEKRLNKDLNEFYQGGYDARTILFWFNPSSASGRQMLFSAGRLDGTAVEFFDDTLRTRVNHTSGDTTESFDLNFPLTTTGQWFQYALVFNEGQLTLYINGSEIGTIATGIEMMNEDPESAELGCQADVGPFGNGGFEQQSSFYNGKLDEFRMYRSALSAEDILANYRNIISAVGTNPANHKMRIYPNPASDHIFISLPGDEHATGYQLIDLSGKIICSGILTGTGNTPMLSLPAHRPGVVILRVVTGSNVYTVRIVITH